MSNPEQPPGWSDQSWQPMPPTAPTTPGAIVPAVPPSAPPTSPMYPPVSGYPTSGGYGDTQQYPGAQQQGYPQGAYGTPYAAGYGYGYPAPAPPTNGMAIGSMVVSIVAIAGLCAYGFGGLLGILGAILGHVARRQIKERGEGGDGMALAGVIMGWIATALGVIIIGIVVVVIILAVNADPNSSSDFDDVMRTLDFMRAALR